MSLMATTAYGFGVIDTEVDEDDYIGEVPYVLTVSRLSQPVSDAPAAVTVIDREMIRASGIVELPEIFRLVPGFYVATNASLVHGTNHAVSYHGMTNAYSGGMQVLVDGRSAYSPLYGGVQWSELPISIVDIERIEVTRGPNAASYGANSYFGVINIITSAASEVRGNSVVARHGGQRNELFYRYGGNQGDLNYRITAGYTQDNGLHTRNDFKRTRFMNARADYQLDNNDNIELIFGIAAGARGEGDFDQVLYTPTTRKIRNHNVLARWKHQFSDTNEFMLQAYHAFDRSDTTFTSINLRPFIPIVLNDNVVVQNPVEQERLDVEAQHNFSIGRSWRFVWGGNIRRDSMYAPFYLGTSKKDYFDLQRVFGHAEWRAHKKLLLNAGAMIEHNDFTGTDISPRASANFHISPNHTIRLGFSSALRTPNYVEEKFDMSVQIPTTVPNLTLLEKLNNNPGGLEPERIISREIGYIGKVGAVNIDARIFHDNLYKQISTEDAPFVAPAGLTLITDPEDVEGAINLGSAEVNGFETQLKWDITRKTNLLLNYAHVRIRGDEDRLERDFLDSMPSNTVSTLLTHRFDYAWDASLAYYQTSKATLMGDGQSVDLIRRCDIRLAKQFDVRQLDGEFSLVVENLFNKHYLEFAENNQHKRRLRLNLTLNF